MPEGDTIFRTASVLRRALVGGTVRRALAQPGPGMARVPRLEALVGRRVEAVEARGKHLLIGFSGGLWLRTHMRMKGSWHRYRPGEAWRLPLARASCLLETDTAVAVCFDAPVVELLTDAELSRHRGLRSLGPDLLAPEPDLAEAVRRLRERASVALGEALLDQRALAGIGNVIKSEACFMERLDPWAPVGSYSDEELTSVVGRARALLAANTGGGGRVTTGLRGRGRSLWVYERAGRPCRRCRSVILARRQGEQARSTYWCPSCQLSRVSAVSGVSGISGVSEREEPPAPSPGARRASPASSPRRSGPRARGDG
jgi:endonuclease-8